MILLLLFLLCVLIKPFFPINVCLGTQERYVLSNNFVYPLINSIASNIINSAEPLSIERERGVGFSLGSLEGSEEVLISVASRTGGGNREYYEEFYESLEKHPLFLYYVEDDCDTTYNYLYFKVPDEFQGIAKAFADWESNNE